MLRHTLARTALRTGRRGAAASRVFSTTTQRHAEVELTIGTKIIIPGVVIAILMN